MIEPEEVLARVFGVSPLDLHDDSGPETVSSWDSLAHMTMVMELERAYGISIAVEDALEMRTVARIKRILREYGIKGSGG